MILHHLRFSLLGIVAGLAAQSAPPSLCWQRRGSPEGRQDHAMAFDANRQSVLLFGGTDGSVVFDDTWGWDGQAWRSYGGDHPPARSQHAMAFDALRNRVVLFGGLSGSNYYNDTWEWDGLGWRRMAPATSPPARRFHAMAYDYVSQRVVVHGGQGVSSTLGDTWSWDGTTWQQVQGPGPGPRQGHAMDADSMGLVLFGGAGQPNQTWVFRQGAWQMLSPVTSPPAVARHTLTYEAALSKTFLYTGTRCFEWDGTTWTVLSASVPPSRSDHAAAYDFVRNEVVMFSGSNREDTWTWNGTVWAEEELAPTARDAVAMCAANAQGTAVLLHGGSTGSTETWQWNGDAWQRLQPATPPARENHSLAFDPATRQPLMFGGWDGGRRTATTYAWNGSVWTLLAPPAAPSPRQMHAACSVDGGNRSGVLVFGGNDSGNAYLNDAWLWDGTTWAAFAASSPTAPPARRFTAMAQEPGRASVLLFGGENGQGDLGDTWRLDLATQTWSLLTLATSPLARRGQRMLADAARGRILMVGGYGVADPVWEWDPAASSWTQFPPQMAGPTGLYLPGLASGPGGQIVLFGGRDPSGFKDRTWTVPGYVTAAVQSIGVGCGLPQGSPPSLANIGLPYIGNTFTLRVSGLPLSGTVSAVLFLDVALTSLTLPQCPSCTLRVAGQLTVPLQVVAGTGNVAVPVPCRPILRNQVLHAQALALNPSFSCLGSLGMTNALSLTVGAY